jgi:hypothetical protein
MPSARSARRAQAAGGAPVAGRLPTPPGARPGTCPAVRVPGQADAHAAAKPRRRRIAARTGSRGASQGRRRRAQRSLDPRRASQTISIGGDAEPGSALTRAEAQATPAGTPEPGTALTRAQPSPPPATTPRARHHPTRPSHRQPRRRRRTRHYPHPASATAKPKPSDPGAKLRRERGADPDDPTAKLDLAAPVGEQPQPRELPAAVFSMVDEQPSDRGARCRPRQR